MRWIGVIVLALLLVIAAYTSKQREHASSATEPRSLLGARKGFFTKLVRRETVGVPVPAPPAGVFQIIQYSSAIGKLSAYVTPPPGDGHRHPAIIWLAGGFDNSIGESAWVPSSPDNDQSARAFREAGITLMLPSLRGGNQNPGCLEGFYGEVDDVLAAAKHLARLDYVDARRIYLGGHSTGGTLALLVAEAPYPFRAVFAFGPLAKVSGYGAAKLPFSLASRMELKLRSPDQWLHAISAPTFVFEGVVAPGNLSELVALSRASSNPRLHFHPVKGVDHFSILAPVSKLIARKVLSDEGPSANIAFTDLELTESLKP